MAGRDLTRVLLLLCAACAPEAPAARPATVLLPPPVAPTPQTNATADPEPASDPEPPRAITNTDPTLARCLAEREKPFTPTQRALLTLLLSGVDGQCMLVDPDAWFWNRRPFLIPPARCKFEIARIYDDASRPIDAVHWLRRAIFEHPGEDHAFAAADHYIEMLRDRAKSSHPKYSSPCYDVLRADLEPIACMCEGGKHPDWCLRIRVMRFHLAHLPIARQAPQPPPPIVSCPDTHLYTMERLCRPLPPIVPANCP